MTAPAYQPCSVARLLVAVLGITLEEAYRRSGLALCEVCGKASTRYEYYPFCGKKHWKQVSQPSYVTVICDWCQQPFPRRVADLISQTNRTGQRYIVCNRYCQGKLTADRWGFKRGHAPTSPAAGNVRTHCGKGHEYTPENTGWFMSQQDGKQRYCRQCQLDWKRAAHQR